MAREAFLPSRCKSDHLCWIDAAAGDEAELLAQHGDLKGLRALAAVGDEAIMRLWNLALAAR